MARLKGEVELAELDGHPFAGAVAETIEDAFHVLEGLELRSLKTFTIHVIDDDPRIAAVTARRLEAMGWEAVAAAVIPSRLALGDRVLVDYGVLEAADDKTRAALRRIRFIVMSGSVQPADRQQALSWGARHYLIKPVDFGQLHQLLSGL
ncbi:MAG: hypothetical protein M3069_31295 [Chloroflexota bacterium]|nr:hypothetical protein [Chloroflexota bacterium]